jgi:PAS domain S-box-containing protein
MKSRPSPTQAPGNDKSRLARASKKIKAEIEVRFGFFSPFFTPALETPEILENLWRQTLSAYVNNPLPALFKEKLFAYLSRYCAVPYCIICHSCALRPLGMTAAEVLALLTEPAPATEIEIGKHRDLLAAQFSPLEEWPAPGSALDESLMACSIFSFLNPAQAEDCRAQMRHLLGKEKYDYLMLFLGYVKTCHLWVEAHPELVYEADQRARDNLGPLLAEEPRLAEFFRDYRELIARERQGRDDSAAMNHLHELGTRLVGVSDLQELLEEILNAAIALQNADFGNIQIYNRETGALKIVAQRGFKRDFLDYFDSVPEGQAACGLALQQRRRVIIEDVEVDPGFTPHRQIAASAGFRAVQSTPLFSRDGEPVGVLSTHFRQPHRSSEHDLQLTDLYFRLAAELIGSKRAESALRESENRFRNMADTAPVLIWISGTDKLCTFFNKPWLDFTGRTMEEELGIGWAESVYPEDYGRCLETYVTSFEARESFKMEYRLRRYDGEYRWVLDQGIPQFSPSGDFIGYIGSCIDITERRKTEQALRESEDRISGIINSAMDAVISMDDGQRIILFNAAAEKMFGYLAAEVIGRPISLIIPERFRASHEGHIRRFGATGETSRAMGALGAVSGLRRNGEEFPIEASISQLESGGQKLFTVILRDITERKRAEDRLIEQATLLDQSHEAIVVRDLDNRIRYWGRGAERLYGWTAEEAVGRPIGELTYRESLSQLAEATGIVIEKGAWNGELRHITKYGREVIVEGHWTLVRDAEGNPKTILTINTDITEKKKFESQFLRAQRLESIGTLASGIAHDLNNILSPILMGAQMLQMRLQDEANQRLLGVMLTNAERGAEMIKQILSFAKGVSGERVAIQPKHLIREIVKVAEETFPKSLRITQRISESLWTTSGDATQLQQVLMNLCVNARDAMPSGGELTIVAENQAIDEIYAGMLRGAYAGNFIVVTVTDTGMGIPPEIIDRIFDPFFTTKESGRGTGLGLATVQGIVTSHGGFITVESQLRLGTTFKIYLPAHEAANRKEVEEIRHEILHGGGEMVLVIDDEDAIREMTRTTLERFGYRALTADNGATALGVFASHKEEISLVITDMMMPVMDGPVTIRALQKLNPQVRIIASSGLAESINTADLDRLGVKTFLTKPYDAKALLKTVAQALRQDTFAA